MSQKSSVPQAAKSVSQVLMSDSAEILIGVTWGSWFRGMLLTMARQACRSPNWPITTSSNRVLALVQINLLVW